MEVSSWLDVAYVASALCFILCIFGLNQQATARAGNAAGVLGMTLAVVCTYLWFNLDEHQGTTTADGQVWWILPAAVLPGVVLGMLMAAAVKMTQMPQMVGLLNSFGGLAACLAAVSLFLSDNVEQGLSEGESRLQVRWETSTQPHALCIQHRAGRIFHSEVLEAPRENPLSYHAHALS
jgi:NAD/NADP transhydrogenase beta subunit